MLFWYSFWLWWHDRPASLGISADKVPGHIFFTYMYSWSVPQQCVPLDLYLMRIGIGFDHTQAIYYRARNTVHSVEGPLRKRKVCDTFVSFAQVAKLLLLMYCEPFSLLSFSGSALYGALDVELGWGVHLRASNDYVHAQSLSQGICATVTLVFETWQRLINSLGIEPLRKKSPTRALLCLTPEKRNSPAAKWRPFIRRSPGCSSTY